MHDAIVSVPPAVNEPMLGYAAGSPERTRLQAALAQIEREVIEIPCVVGGQRVTTGKIREVVMPHRHKHVVARFHAATEEVAERAILAALEARREWSAMRWEARAAILLRAAELLSTTWRMRLNAATMHGQSKTRAPGRDRRRVRAHRFLAVQRPVRRRALPRPAAVERRRVEHDRAPPARRLHVRADAFQLHRDPPATCRWPPR